MTDDKLNHRYQTLLMYEQRIVSAPLAAESLEVSERHFFRVLDRFQRGNRDIACLRFQSHPAWNKSPREIEEKILGINKEYPLALNSHLSWLAWDLHRMEIKSSTARNILLRNNVYTPFKDKKERAYKKFQATKFGALVQLDATDGYWLKGYPMLHLIVALDDASRTVLAARFCEHDSTLENMLVIKGIISKYGVPVLFYADNDSKFKVMRHGQSHYQRYQEKTLAGETETEIRRALNEVGSALLCHAPFHPQGKGKLEKLFRFIQDCFIKNQRTDNLEELNQNLKRWLSWYDQRGHRTLGEAPKIAREKLIRAAQVAFRPLKKGLNLDAIFSVKEERKPNKYNIFSFQGKDYQLPLDKIVYPSKVELRILPDNRILVFDQKKELLVQLKG